MPTPFRQLESVTSYTADGVRTAWDFSFSSGYLDKAHVKAYQLSPLGVRTEVPVTLGMFAGPYQLTITPPIPLGYELTIYRDTPTAAPLVDFTDAAAFTEVALDTVVKQATFAAAETQDALSVASARIDQIGAFAQAASDNAALALGYKNAAATSATNAATSETNAAGSATAAAASALSVNGANLLHLAGAETITGVKTFSAQPVGITKASVGLGNVDNTADASKPVSTAQQSALNALMATFRNRLINGNFYINQRGVVAASTAYAAGAYVVDRWKAGAAGVTLSWALSGSDVVVTITAGSLMQVIEDANVEGGVYALSHAGTAQARVGINGAAPAAAYAAATVAAPIVTSAATAKQTITVEFSTGTVSKAQLEAVDAASPKTTLFERRHTGLELLMCQRYYQQGIVRWDGQATGTVAYSTLAVFVTPMRVSPTVTSSSVQALNFPAAGNPINVTSVGFYDYRTASATGVAAFVSNWTASAEL